MIHAVKINLFKELLLFLIELSLSL